MANIHLSDEPRFHAKAVSFVSLLRSGILMQWRSMAESRSHA